MDCPPPEAPIWISRLMRIPRSGFASTVGPTDGPSPPSPCLSEWHLPLMRDQAACAINLSSREKRPDNAGRLVGKCNGHNSCRALGQELLGPDRSPAPSLIADQRGSTEN